MRALTLTAKRKFDLIEKPIPQAGENTAVIKISHAGICGSDIHMIWDAGHRAGTNFVIGHEFCGTISDPGNSDFRVGERVVAMEITPCGQCEFCKSGRPQLCGKVMGGPGLAFDGGYAEYTAVRSDMILRLPDTVSDLEGALVEPTAISMHAVRLAGVGPGSKVLVVGGGAIGLFAAACAKALDAAYVGLTEVNASRIRLAEESTFVTRVFHGGAEDLAQQLAAASEGGFDVVVECSGNAAAADVGLHALKRGGKMMAVAYGKNPTLDLFNLVNNEWSIGGSLFFTVEDFQLVIDLMAEKKLDLAKYAEVIPMEKAQSAFEAVTGGGECAVKYVMDMSL